MYEVCSGGEEVLAFVDSGVMGVGVDEVVCGFFHRDG